MLASAAEPSTVAQSAEAAKGASVAEQVTAAARETLTDLSQLDPQVAGLNLALSLLIMGCALGLIWSLRRIFDHLLRRFAAETPAEVEKPDTPHAARMTWFLLRLAIAALAVLLVAGVWGIDLLAWLTDGAGVALMRASAVVILAVGAVEVTGFAVNRLVDGVARRSRNARRAAQIRTLGPLIRGVIQGVFLVVATLTFLSEVGVEVAPLLASAGVVGIAIGFGAQTLVKDFLTGLFLIAEDVVSVGDNVRIREFGGTVEAMTLRTIRLRDQDGTLHIFPYSEAQVIHNRTASFSAYLADVLVPYGADVDRALAAMGRVGEEMRAAPDFARKITRPVEVLGVERLDPTGVLLRARITTRPKDQWDVGREYNRRLKAAFEAEGVDIAYRPVGPPAPTVPTAAHAEISPLEPQKPSNPKS